MRTKIQDLITTQPGYLPKIGSKSELEELNENEFILPLYSNSVPQDLDGQSIEVQYKSKTRRKRFRSRNFTTDYVNQSGSSTKQTSEMKLVAHKNPFNIELHEISDEDETIAVGLPNVRSLSIISPKPRFMRARQYFIRLRKGLLDWIDFQTTKLQQAELNQNSKEASEVSRNLNRVQQRLNTITQLEEEYYRYWELYGR
ncbi:hypothetical protein FGIG_11630, partial [Fasciola gigantica]